MIFAVASYSPKTPEQRQCDCFNTPNDDMENGIVHIRNTVVRFATTSEQEKTKSKASKRDLFMPNALKEFPQTV